MPANSTWTPARNVTLSVGGSVIPATNCEYSDSLGKFDATTLVAQGWAENGSDIREVSIRGSYLQDSTAGAVNLDLNGGLVTITWTCVSEQTHTGQFRLFSRGKTGGPRGALSISFSADSHGPVTTS